MPDDKQRQALHDAAAHGSFLARRMLEAAHQVKQADHEVAMEHIGALLFAAQTATYRYETLRFVNAALDRSREARGYKLVDGEWVKSIPSAPTSMATEKRKSDPELARESVESRPASVCNSSKLVGLQAAVTDTLSVLNAKRHAGSPTTETLSQDLLQAVISICDERKAVAEAVSYMFSRIPAKYRFSLGGHTDVVRNIGDLARSVKAALNGLLNAEADAQSVADKEYEELRRAARTALVMIRRLNTTESFLSVPESDKVVAAELVRAALDVVTEKFKCESHKTTV